MARERIAFRASKDSGALDGVKIGWGNEPDDPDIHVRWDGTRLIVDQKTADSEIRWGVDGAGIDQRWFGDTASAFMLWDQSLDELVFGGAASMRYADNAPVTFGDLAGGDVTLKWNGSALEMLPAVDDTGAFNIGNGTTDMDFVVFLGAVAKKVTFDVGNSKVTFDVEIDGTGVKPADVGTTPATAAALMVNLIAGAGGDTTIVTTGVGGIGAGYTLLCGAGGIAAAAATASTGGKGGSFTWTAGAGGAANDAAAVGVNVGGAGGDYVLAAGAGGATLNGSSNTGGAGGSVTLSAGAGGAGATAAGAPGSVNVGAGIFKHAAPQTIAMAASAVTLTLVPGTPTGTLMTSNVLYADAGGSTQNLLLPPEADLTGAVLVIVNTGGETIEIQNNSGGAVLTLETANTAIVTCDGTTLRGVVGLP